MASHQQTAMTQLANVLGEFHRFDRQMPVIQAMLLVFIASRDAGPGTGATGQDACDYFELEPSRVSRNIKRLVAAGLVERTRGDLGMKHSRVTPAGRYLVAWLADIWKGHSAGAERPSAVLGR